MNICVNADQTDAKEGLTAYKTAPSLDPTSTTTLSLILLARATWYKNCNWRTDAEWDMKSSEIQNMSNMLMVEWSRAYLVASLGESCSQDSNCAKVSRCRKARPHLLQKTKMHPHVRCCLGYSLHTPMCVKTKVSWLSICSYTKTYFFAIWYQCFLARRFSRYRNTCP